MQESVIFHPLARSELHSTALYYEDQRVGLGSEFRDEAWMVQAFIVANPTRYSIRITDVRRANLKRFPYHLNYIIHGETIAIVAISHDKQRPFYWRDRLADRGWMEE